MSDTQDLFLIAAVWTAIAALIVKFLPNWPARITVFALLVGIPFWELPYGYFNFRQLCGSEATLKATEKIVPQVSVCIEHLDVGLYDRLVRAGFSRIEVTGKSDNAKAYASSGIVRMTSRDKVQSAYCVQHKNNIDMPWRVSRTDTLVVRSSDDRVVAKQSVLFWWGTWWQQEARPVLGRGGICFDDPYRPYLALKEGSL